MKNKTINPQGKTLRKQLMKNAFCLPKGIAGQIGGRLMALDRVLPAWVLEVLEVKSSDSVLEVASGPGVALELASKIVKEKEIAGIDLSDTMLAMAHKRNRKAIEAGRVKLYKGTVDQLPFDNSTFDVAFTINSLHLWPDPVKGLKEIKRTLHPGGRLGLAISRFSYASPDKFGDFLIEAGFKDIRVSTGDRGTCVTGKVI